MQKFGSFFLSYGIVILAVVFVTACSPEGFFTKLQDDPVWVDPDEAKNTAAGTADAGGPGKGIYGRICAACHLGSGKGVPGNNIPSLVGSAFATGDAGIPIRILLHGFKGPIERNGVQINGQMAAWKDQLSDQEIADVLTYVRGAFGNSAGAVTPEEVLAIRDETAARRQAFTEAELQ